MTCLAQGTRLPLACTCPCTAAQRCDSLEVTPSSILPPTCAPICHALTPSLLLAPFTRSKPSGAADGASGELWTRHLGKLSAGSQPPQHQHQLPPQHAEPAALRSGLGALHGFGAPRQRHGVARVHAEPRHVAAAAPAQPRQRHHRREPGSAAQVRGTALTVCLSKPDSEAGCRLFAGRRLSARLSLTLLGALGSHSWRHGLLILHTACSDHAPCHGFRPSLTSVKQKPPPCRPAAACPPFHQVLCFSGREWPPAAPPHRDCRSRLPCRSYRCRCAGCGQQH